MLYQLHICADGNNTGRKVIIHIVRQIVLCTLLLAGSVLHSVSIAADTPQSASTDAIINGFPAAAAQPWMVALIRNTTRTDLPTKRLQFCGGTLIASQWVLTAAHCVLARSVTDMSLVIGEVNLDAPGIKLHKINQIVIHPEYNARTFANDIALLRLASPTTNNPLELISHAADPFRSGQNASVYGWGLTYIDDRKCKAIFPNSPVNSQNFECKIYDLVPGSRAKQAELLQTQLILLSHQECLARIAKLLEFLEVPPGSAGDLDEFVVDSQFCAYDPQEQRGVCFGDSGGPLVIERDGKQLLAGISSLIYGSGGCARKFSTDLFTKTTVFLDFIDDVLHRDYQLSFENFCPPKLTPAIEYGVLDNGKSKVRIYWEPYAQATQYLLSYSSNPQSDPQINTVKLDASVTEVMAELVASSRFYMSVQSVNGFCSGAHSDPVLIQVPAL